MNRNVPVLIQWLVIVASFFAVAALAYTGHPVDAPTAGALAAGFLGLSAKASTSVIANTSRLGEGAASLAHLATPVVHELVEAVHEPPQVDYRQLAELLAPKVLDALPAVVAAHAASRDRETPVIEIAAPAHAPDAAPTVPALPRPTPPPLPVTEPSEPPEITAARALVASFEAKKGQHT